MKFRFTNRTNYSGLAVLILFCFCPHLRAGDWPQFLGPNRDGTVSASNVMKVWPEDGLRQLWQEQVGQGFSGPVVGDNRLILFHRVEKLQKVECMDAQTGERLWNFAYSATYRDDFGFDEGPRAVPAISDNKVYTLGANGMFHCLNVRTGEKLWGLDVRKRFEAPKGFFGMACSPLVAGDAVVLIIGGANGAGIVAFDKESGELLWKTANHEAGYSSPVVAELLGQQELLCFTRSGFLVIHPQTGELKIDFPWRSRMHASVNAATPLIVEDHLFLSASYQTGAICLQRTDQGLEEIWSGENILSNHYATSMYHEGFLYGLHGRHDFPGGTELRCVEFRTGKVRWSEPGLDGANLILADDQLLLLTEHGELLVIPAQPQEYAIAGRYQILPGGVRAYPALAHGKFYARSKDRLVCLNLQAKP